jgi:hypothetical protein
MKMTVFWDVAPCSLVEIDRQFRGTYCLHLNTSRMSVNFYETIRHNIPEDIFIQFVFERYVYMYVFLNATDILIPSRLSSLFIHCPSSNPFSVTETWIPFIRLTLGSSVYLFPGVIHSSTCLDHLYSRDLRSNYRLTYRLSWPKVPWFSSGLPGI